MLFGKKCSGECIDGVPLHDSASSYDSSDSDDNRVSKPKNESQSESEKVSKDKKPKSNAAGFSMTLSHISSPGSNTMQSSALSNKKGVQMKSAAEIGAIKMKIGTQVISHNLVYLNEIWLSVGSCFIVCL